MGLMSRFTTMVKAKFSSILDDAEDPAEMLDYSYERLQEMLREVKAGVVEMVTAKQRIQLQADRVRGNIEKLQRQAQQALDVDREDLARLALERKHAAELELEGLDAQIEGMEEEQRKLVESEARLKQKIEAFKHKKEVLKAQHAAAQASVHIGSAFGGVNEEMNDVTMAMQRAEDKTEKMRAKSAAIDELVDQGVLDDFNGPRDDIERELSKMGSSGSVERELAALKAKREPVEDPEPVPAGAARE